MISQNLKEHLISRSSRSHLMFLKLIELLENSNHYFIGGKLKGPVGLATYQKAYFDMNKLRFGDDQLVFFVILHEYCHVLKIEKVGKEGMIKSLSTNELELFIEHIIYEEILADRFACLMFYLLNKELYPRYRTQMLDVMQYQVEFINRNKSLFGMIKDEESYNEVLNSFIVDEVD